MRPSEVINKKAVTKECEHPDCNKVFGRKLYRNGRLEDYDNFIIRRYCSRVCKYNRNKRLQAA
jgi:hypothetical protein